ncbi:MAG TPA: caspase family protein, partial [Gemmatirosa sp.]
MSSSPALPAAATKRALLVGIDAYQFVSGLEGCVNDARLMQRLLVDTFGFPSASVTLLTDAGATRDGILAALDALVAATGTDDVVVVYYAGHGSQMTDRSGLKASGMDSTLLPVDSGRDWTAQGGENHPNRDITDDEINARLAALADRTRFTTVIVDACHSGTITRDAVGPTFGVRSRGIAPDTRPASELPPAPAVARGRGDGGPLPSGWAPLADRYVLIAGCRDDERSYEYRAPGDGGTVTHGALTYFLAQALAAPVPNTTYRDVFERAAAQVTAANGEQHPQLEGRTDREVLGVRDVAPARFVRVLAADGDHVTLGIGAALGAAPGARYDVHAQGTKDPTTATPLATAEIVTVSAVTSEARLLSGAGAVAADARAFPTTAPDPDRRLRGQLVVAAGAADPDGQAGTLRAALGASPLVALVDDDQPAAVRVYLIGARAAAAPGDPVPQLGAVAGPTWAIVGDDGQLLAPVKPAAVTDDVRQNVETIARYRQALALTNPDPASGLAGRFSLDLLRQNADGTWAVAAPDGGLVAYEEGDRIGFRVTSRHDAPVYLNLVDFGLTGRVALVYPPTGAADTLAPGVTFDLLGQRPANRGWPVTWPAGLPFEGGPGTADGVETVKLFAATGPADFSFLTQAAVRDATRGSRRPTALELLMRTATGAPTRDIGDDAPAAPTSDWTTVDRAFVVRRRRSAPLPAGGAPVTVGATTLRAPALVGEVTATAGPRPTVAPAGAVSSVTA